MNRPAVYLNSGKRQCLPRPRILALPGFERIVMTDYTPPLKDLLFNIHALSGIDEVLKLKRFADFDGDLIDQVIEQACRFSAEVIAPLNVPGDQAGANLVDGKVEIPAGFADAYSQFVENGWQSMPVAPEHGGMGFPEIATVAAVESWQTACLAFSLAPMLTSSAIIAVAKHASTALQQTYLPKLVTGEWSGTMVLTEPHAGSDLAALTCKAEPDGDRYRISGTKIFITWGDHEMADNVVHLVLARLPDAPDGVRGISMFLVPKFLLNDDGSPGARNDVHVASLEHKLGIHASPTCVLNFGESEGAIGYLVGEENQGLACMFTMMNHARIEVGVQGLAVSERAYQLARDYAKDRIQGRAPGVPGRVSIIHHADVRRMLLLMKAGTEAMRSVAVVTAGVHDLSNHADSAEGREAASRRLALLTPIVKGWMTELSQEITGLGVQIHGGMGFIEETGAAQHVRDARILTIYEGTTGIQAGDFAGRKILADEGREIRSLIAEMNDFNDRLTDEQLIEIRDKLGQGIDHLEATVAWLLENAPDDPFAPGTAAVNLLMLAGTVFGGYQMARAAAAIVDGAAAEDTDWAASKLLTARFYATQVLPRAGAYHAAATAGSDSVMAIPETAFCL